MRQIFRQFLFIFFIIPDKQPVGTKIGVQNDVYLIDLTYITAFFYWMPEWFENGIC